MTDMESLKRDAERLAEAEAFLQRTMDLCLGVLHRDEHAQHNAVNLRNQVDAWFQNKRNADLRSSAAAGSAKKCTRGGCCDERHYAGGVWWRCSLPQGHAERHIMAGDFWCPDDSRPNPFAAHDATKEST
jgi:hypothetical protein